MMRLVTSLAVLGFVAAAGLYLLSDPGYRFSDAPEESVTVADVGPATLPEQSSLDRIGFTAIDEELGITAPTGRTIRFGHVEGGPGSYMPNAQHALFQGVTFTAATGTSEFNGHTQATATVIYGKQGLAPGITDVCFYAANLWMMDSYLRAMSPFAPMASDRQVFTHSWIGGGSPLAVDVLRRTDYEIDHRDVIMVVGVNNDRNSAVPALMGSAYNVIAVGQSRGESSGGYTVFEGDGRCKPDIVGSGSKTSFSTPAVAAVVARLLETALLHTDEVDAEGGKLAARSEVIKAALMAGAEKLPGWKQKDGHPLDEHLGAGYARYDLSFRILTAGAVKPGRVRQTHAWGFEQLEMGDGDMYEFDLTEPLGEGSFMLVWNRRIRGEAEPVANGQGMKWNTEPRLADFDLKLTHIDDLGKQRVYGLSASKVDNVEHIYVPQLPAGRYRIEVQRVDELDELWDYALAWRMEAFAAQEAEGGR